MIALKCPQCGSTDTECYPPYLELKCNDCRGIFRRVAPAPISEQPEKPVEPPVPKPVVKDPRKLDSFYPQSQDPPYTPPVDSQPPIKRPAPSSPTQEPVLVEYPQPIDADEVLFPPEREIAPINNSLELDPELRLFSVRDSSDRILNRLTIKELVYHHFSNRQPVSVVSKFIVSLDSDESMYSRPRVRIGEEWTAIDLGWIGEVKDRAGMVVIQNITGKALQTQPSPEQLAELNSRVVEVGLEILGEVHPITEVPRTESLRLRLLPGHSYKLRSRAGKCEIDLYVYPR